MHPPDLALDNVPLAVFRTDDETLYFMGVKRTQALACVVEFHDNRVPLLLPRGEFRRAVGQVLETVVFGQGPAGQAPADLLLLLRMDVLAFANIDDNGLFRQSELEALRDMDEENPNEVDAREKGLSFVQLDGDIGCMVNGAGLAMATMDAIKYFGGEPANFLDVGGSSNPEKVVHAFNLILSTGNIKAILINIFGGITRCDDIAKGILESLERIEIDVPIVVRLVGTNSEQGLAMLEGSRLHPAQSLSEGVKKAIELSKGA